MIKTGDFDHDVRNGYYTWIEEQRYRYRNTKEPLALDSFPDTWDQDFREFLIRQGVPDKYARGVASAAWQRGHSNGYQQVLNCAIDLIEIFRPTAD